MLHPTPTLLRTLAAPSRHLLAPSTLLTRRTLTTTTPTPSTTTPSSPQPTTTTTPETTAPTPGTRPPYHVTRTPSSQLRVYHLAKRGGNKLLTTVKGIEGNRQALAADLAGALGLGAKEVGTNNLTGHVFVSVGAALSFLSPAAAGFVSFLLFIFLSAGHVLLPYLAELLGLREGMGWMDVEWRVMIRLVWFGLVCVLWEQVTD